MEPRESTKLEYIKQPHIIAIIIVVVLIIFGAIFTSTRRISNTNRLANMETAEACKNFITDENLCNFAASNEINSTNTHVMTITEVKESSTTNTIIEIESVDRNKSTTYKDGKEVDSSVVLGESSYVKDYQDSVWAHFKDTTYQPMDQSVKYDFTTETSTDVDEFKNNYHAEGKEACGDLMCFKYKVDDNQEASATTYLWFDDKEFIPRRIMMVSEESTVNTVFNYKEVKIEAPTPTKEVSVDDIQEYLDE